MPTSLMDFNCQSLQLEKYLECSLSVIKFTTNGDLIFSISTDVVEQQSNTTHKGNDIPSDITSYKYHIKIRLEKQYFILHAISCQQMLKS